MVMDAGEWVRQSEYDLETADYMFRGGRYFYTVFMCHLAVEKGLKALYQDRLGQGPPKVHNLVYLVKQVGLSPPENIARFMVKLSEASVATRYPESIAKLQKDFGRAVSRAILDQSREALKWIKEQL